MAGGGGGRAHGGCQSVHEGLCLPGPGEQLPAGPEGHEGFGLYQGLNSGCKQAEAREIRSLER